MTADSKRILGTMMHGNSVDYTSASVVPVSETSRSPEADLLKDNDPAHLRRRAVRGGSLKLTVRLATQLIAWMTTFVVIRILSPADYGLFVIAALFWGLADILADAGFGRALVQKKDVTRADIAAVFTVSLAVSTGIYIVIWGISAPVASYFESPDLALLLRLIALTLFLAPIEIIGESSLERQLRFGTLCMIEAGVALLSSGVVLILAFQGFGVWALAWSFICARVSKPLLFWYVSACRPALAIPTADSAGLLRYGLTITASSLVWYFFESADRAVISAVLGQVAVGYFAVAMLIVKLPVDKITVAINNIVFAIFCKLQHDLGRIRNWFVRLLVFQLMFLCPALIGIALVADDAVPLVLGEQWQSVALPLQILAPVGIFIVIGTSFNPLFHAIGRPDITLKFDCACAASLPVAFFIGAYFFGIVGVCLAWLALYPLLIAALIHATKSITNIKVADLIRTATPIVLGTLFMGVMVAATRYLLPDAVPPFSRLATLIAMGLFSYSAWMLAFARKMVLADIMVVWSELRGNRSAAP